jgi:hypothetical protein
LSYPVEVECDTAAELARLDRVERQLRRIDALTEGAKRELALARKLAWTRASQRLDIDALLERLAS